MKSVKERRERKEEEESARLRREEAQQLYGITLLSPEEQAKIRATKDQIPLFKTEE